MNGNMDRRTFAGVGTVALFSRDRRTHGLFRGAWLRAIEAEGRHHEFHTRGQGGAASVRHLAGFMRARRARRLIFGTAEIALLCPFAGKDDIFVFTGMGRLLQQGDARARWMLRFFRAMNRGQQVVVLNEDDRSLLHPVYGDQISVLPGEGYRFDRDLPRRYHPGPLRLAYAGRLLRSKGVDILIEACRRVDADLLLMGDVDFGNSDAVDTAWLTRQISEANGRIRHVGFVDDVRMQLADADVYVSLSEREGLPFGVLDGINAGCALLLSDVPGHREFARLPGLTFVDADRESLTAVIADMIARRDDYLTFDARGRLDACEANYGFEAVVSRIRAILFGPRSV